jgi:hypothetical protein
VNQLNVVLGFECDVRVDFVSVPVEEVEVEQVSVASLKREII